MNSCSQLVNLCPFKPRSSYIIGRIKNMIWRGYYGLSHNGKGGRGCQQRWTHKSSLQGGFRRRGWFCVYLIFPILSLLSQQDRKLRLWWWWHYRLFLAVLCRRKRELAAVMVYRPRSMGWEKKKLIFKVYSIIHPHSQASVRYLWYNLLQYTRQKDVINFLLS